jgi:2-furoyl-CoA dehydrogenase large subunit
VARVALSDLAPPSSATLSGGLEGPLGASAGTGHVRLAPHGAGTRIDYDYRVEISGKAAAVGGRMLEGATRILINQFFQRLTSEMSRGSAAGPAPSWWRRLLRMLGLAG